MNIYTFYDIIIRKRHKKIFHTPENGPNRAAKGENYLWNCANCINFITIANEGTISAAAKRLHISQPPLSHQMKLLEEELGATLFDRGARSIRLTAAGQALYEKASAILDLTRQAREETSLLEHEVAGTLKLGLVSSAGEFAVQTLFSPFLKAYPKVVFDIHESNSYHLLELINAGLIDLALVRTPFPSAGLGCLSFTPEPFYAVGQESFFEGLPHTEKLALEQLAQLPLIIYKRWEGLIMDYYTKASLQPHILCKNDDARTSLLWARAGLGIALIPASALYSNPAPDLAHKTITDSFLHSSICLIHKENKHIPNTARTFLEYSKKLLNSSQL